ncbi:MAG TPA: histidine kinase [Streptosporangiaceae bacterium]
MARFRAGPWVRGRAARWSGHADSLVVAALIAFSFVPGAADKGVDLAEMGHRPLDAAGLGLLLAQSVPLLARRRWPGACLAVVAAAFCAFQLLGYLPRFGSLGLLVALYGAGLGLRRHRTIAAVAAAAAYTASAVAVHVAGSRERSMDYLTFGLVLAACWGAGGWARARGEAAEARRLREEDAAVAAERARIARELHDVVTHHVTAMVVQADTAAYLTEEPDRVAAGLSAIGGAGRRALTDLRHLLGALDAAEPEPSPKGLAELVERSRAVGQPVELVERGEPRPMGDAARTAAYRVVQEALTNALKHAVGARTVVSVEHGAEAMDVEVTTDGPARTGLGRGGGRGLAGLRERVGVVGGDLRTGERPGGGFTVHARIPTGAP